MQENLNVETLQKQFQIVKSETNTSHVMEYGDMVSSRLIFDEVVKLDMKKDILCIYAVTLDTKLTVLS